MSIQCETLEITRRLDACMATAWMHTWLQAGCINGCRLRAYMAASWRHTWLQAAGTGLQAAGTGLQVGCIHGCRHIAAGVRDAAAPVVSPCQIAPSERRRHQRGHAHAVAPAWVRAVEIGDCGVGIGGPVLGHSRYSATAALRDARSQRLARRHPCSHLPL